jgi:hypothetical protein
MAAPEFARQFTLSHTRRAMENDDVIGHSIAEPLQHLMKEIIPAHKGKISAGRDIALKAA